MWSKIREKWVLQSVKYTFLVHNAAPNVDNMFDAVFWRFDMFAIFVEQRRCFVVVVVVAFRFFVWFSSSTLWCRILFDLQLQRQQGILLHNHVAATIDLPNAFACSMLLFVNVAIEIIETFDSDVSLFQCNFDRFFFLFFDRYTDATELE